MKKVLITAGSTSSPIDKVREISNIFHGRTGMAIAEFFVCQNIFCTLVTSAKDKIQFDDHGRLRIGRFRTFDELKEAMEIEVKYGDYDTIIHSAAVSDYFVSGVLDHELNPLNASTKISSAHEKLYLELKQNIKIVDQIRTPWSFEGKLVKFKLEVGISDDELLTIARNSMFSSRADFMVANCLEWSRERAYILSAANDGEAVNVERNMLPQELFRRLV